MMTKNEFMNYQAEKVLDYLPEELKKELEVAPVTVVKMNDQKLNGLRFTREDGHASPTHYLDEAFDLYQDGMDPDDIAKTVAGRYEDSFRIAPEVTSSDNIDFEGKSIVFRLVNTNLNKEFLKDVPYMAVGNGLALICDVRLDQHEDGFYTTVVNNSILEMMGRDKVDVFKEAIRQSWDNDGPVMQSMQERLFAGHSENLLKAENPEVDSNDLFVLTNESGVHGAAALFYPDVQEKIADALGGSYYALPSSTEEFIIVSEKMDVSTKKLTEMVRDANQSVVDPSQKLSDKVFKYDKDTQILYDVTFKRELDSKTAEARC